MKRVTLLCRANEDKHGNPHPLCSPRTGHVVDLPEVGQRLAFYADGVDGDDVEPIFLTRVQAILAPGPLDTTDTIRFKTRNNEYLMQIHNEVKS